MPLPLPLPLSTSGSSKLLTSISMRFSSLLSPLSRLGSAPSMGPPSGTPASRDASGSGAGKLAASRLPWSVQH